MTKHRSADGGYRTRIQYGKYVDLLTLRVKTPTRFVETICVALFSRNIFVSVENPEVHLIPLHDETARESFYFSYRKMYRRRMRTRVLDGLIE
jgi:hypothetical protein